MGIGLAIDENNFFVTEGYLTKRVKKGLPCFASRKTMLQLIWRPPDWIRNLIR